MILRATKPEATDKVLVDRQAMLDVIEIYERAKTDVDYAIYLLETGRTGKAAEIIRKLKVLLG